MNKNIYVVVVLLAAGCSSMPQDGYAPPMDPGRKVSEQVCSRYVDTDGNLMCRELTETERRAMGYESLPQNLTEALAAMEHSELVAEILGEHVFDFFLRNKRAEWDAYRRNVTPYELATYLPVL